MTAKFWRWAPTAILVTGGLLLFGAGQQLTPSLRAPLTAALPQSVNGWSGEDVTISDQEAQVAGFTDYALRMYSDGEAIEEEVAPEWVSVYIGFYEMQTRGRTIHSPKNCLPGAGWEPLSSTPQTLVVGGEEVTVNRYVLQNGEARALVLYWYQGRGRVAHNEYMVKWDLLRDAAVMRRTDEALVRMVVPITESEEAAFELARDVAGDLVLSVEDVLPA